MVIIGVDPAIRKNGFAICFYDTINKTIDFQIMDFIDFVFYVMDRDTYSYKFAVENSNLQNLLKRRGFEVVEISPKQKGAKLEHETFKALTMNMTVSNYKGLKGEQDKRDAFKIALLYEKYKNI